MITALKYFMSCSEVMLLAIFILKFGIVLQCESAHAVDDLVKHRDPPFKDVHFFYDKYKIYNMSNHVFYWLYTREQTKGQLLNRSDPNTKKSTNFNAEHPTKILVHDWFGSFFEKEGFCTHIAKAYFTVGLHNVICVDWMQFSFDIMYASAKLNTKYIGYDIANVLKILTNNMSEGSENIHLIGHGLGAHIVGYTGKKLSGKISRITVSGGACSHAKAFDYFAHSILAKDECKALKCTQWSEYKVGECGELAKSTYMGEHVDKKQNGSYYLWI